VLGSDHKSSFAKICKIRLFAQVYTQVWGWRALNPFGFKTSVPNKENNLFIQINAGEKEADNSAEKKV